MEEQKFATELLSTIKADAKRWFIAFITVLVLWFATIGAFLWYLTIPSEDYSVEVSSEDGNANYIGNDMIGDLYNGESDSKIQPPSSAE